MLALHNLLLLFAKKVVFDLFIYYRRREEVANINLMTEHLNCSKMMKILKKPKRSHMARPRTMATRSEKIRNYGKIDSRGKGKNLTR